MMLPFDSVIPCAPCVKGLERSLILAVRARNRPLMVKSSS